MTQVNLSVKQKQAHGYGEQTCGYQGGDSWGGLEWEIGVSRYKLLYIEWINKVLPYNTREYIQYPMISHNKKEYFLKKNV